MGIDVARQDFIGGGVNGCLEEFVGIGVWSLVQVGEKWKEEGEIDFGKLIFVDSFR